MESDAAVVIQCKMDVSDADKELARVKQKIFKLQESLATKGFKKDALTEQLAQMKAEYAELQNLTTIDAKGNFTNPRVDEFAALGSKIREVESEIAKLDKAIANTNLDLQAEQYYYGDTAQKAAIAAREAERQAAATSEAADATEGVADSAEEAADATEGVADSAEEAAEGEEEAATATSRLADAAEEAQRRMGKFADRIKNLAKRVFVFSLITSALRAMRTWFGNVIKSNKEATAAIAKLKGALLTLIQPLVNVIIPALTTFVNLLTKVVNVAARVLSGIFGTTAEESAKAAEALYNQTSALEGTGDAAKKASKSLASFDEINQLSDNSDSSSSSSSSSIAPDFSGGVGGGLSAVAELFVGVALVALGAVLTFTGASIPTGLAMMAAGAMLIYGAVTSDPTIAQKLVESGLSLVIGVIGAAALALGVLLTITGADIPLGLALIVMGAAALATGAALNGDTIIGFITENINVILMIVTGALLALGAVLALTGANLPLGIALLAVGAIGLVALAVINTDAINKALQGPIGVIIALVSGALLVLGAVLTFTGTNIPLGIGLLLAGAVGLAKVATVNWDAITEAMQGPIGAITALVSASLLVLGVCLLFAGAGIPLGLGLIAVGAAGLAMAIAPNWDFLLEKLRGAWEAIKTWFNEHVAYYLSGEYWGLVGKSLINAFLETIEGGINFVLKGVAALVNGIISLINKIPGIDLEPVDWGHVQLPRLAQGAVIPPNREFLAVLGDQKSGTNIEAPLETIVQAFRQAMSEQGGGRAQTVILQLDRRELGRAVVETGRQESSRIGTALAY